MKKQIFLLALILFSAFILRFYKLGINPPSLSWDEASIGYNAYSISQTLKDEHGRFLPYDYFSAFGDYKPPAAIYLTAISIKLFGLSDWSVRFPFALLGVGSVLLTFLLVEQFRKLYKITTFGFGLSLLASLSLAVSPWHTLLSRQAFEANIATFFILLGVFWVVKGLEKGCFLVPGAVSLALSVYTFNSPRVFVPLLLIGIVVFFYKQLFLNRKWSAISLLVGLIFLLPLIPHLLSPLGQLRFKEVNIFSDAKVVEQANNRQEIEGNTILSKLIHNRRIGYIRLFLAHYFDHFNTDYLFFRGDINPKFSSRSAGEFFLIEAIFLVFGIYFLLSKERRLGLFILYWLIIGLIPAATARETPHALRTEVSLPSWQIISGAGAYFLYLTVKKWRKLLFTIFTIIFGWQFSSYLHNYYIHYPIDYSQDWQYSYKLAAMEIASYEDKYDKIWVSDKYGRPYIFFLIYQKHPPSQFQKNQKTSIDSFGFYHTVGYDKYIFDSLKKVDLKKGKILLIGASDEIPVTAKKLKDIYYLNGEKSLEIAEIVN